MRRFWLDLGWFAATLALATALLTGWRKGQVTLVSGAAGPAIRLLALLVVFAQGCADRMRGREEPAARQGAAPTPGLDATPGDVDVSEHMSQAGDPGEPGPKEMVEGPPLDGAFPRLDHEALTRWIALLGDRGWQTSTYKRITRRLAALPEGTDPNDPAWTELAEALVASAEPFGAAPVGEAFAARWRAHLEARQQGQRDTLEALQGLLLAAEALPLYDAWLAAYVWRRAAPLTASATARARLLGQIERHLRVGHALLKGQLDTGPVEFSAWRSKAAPPKGWSGLLVPRGLAEAARLAFPSADAGTWETAGALVLEVRSVGVTLLRRGHTIVLKPGQQLRLRRLDVLEARGPATLRHAELGDMSVGAGGLMTAWDVGERLNASGGARVREQVAAAQSGDAAALKRLESILPAAHLEIRRAVAEKPDAPGSPGLRTLLALFDE